MRGDEKLAGKASRDYLRSRILVYASSPTS
jgi:hypothetical protein